MDIFDIIDSCSSNSIDKNIVLTEAGVVEKLASKKIRFIKMARL